MFEPIDASFFQQPVLEMTESLLGQYIVHNHPTGLRVGRIVETEAYKGPDDQAAHSFKNKPTKRTQIMFDAPGYVYTYQMHTHTLVNVVAGPIGIPHAILIRAIEPIIGEDIMQERRGIHIKRKDLTNGPGKLAQALDITMTYYGHYWTEEPLYLAKGSIPEDIIVSPRVGVRNSGEASTYPWRFFEKDNPFVSKFR